MMSLRYNLYPPRVSRASCVHARCVTVESAKIGCSSRAQCCYVINNSRNSLSGNSAMNYATTFDETQSHAITRGNKKIVLPICTSKRKLLHFIPSRNKMVYNFAPYFFLLQFIENCVRVCDQARARARLLI